MSECLFLELCCFRCCLYNLLPLSSLLTAEILLPSDSVVTKHTAFLLISETHCFLLLIFFCFICCLQAWNFEVDVNSSSNLLIVSVVYSIMFNVVIFIYKHKTVFFTWAVESLLFTAAVTLLIWLLGHKIHLSQEHGLIFFIKFG